MQESISQSTDNRSTIFLIEEDADAHRLVKQNLRKRGYRVLAVLDLEDAREWVRGAYIHADLVLINLVGKSPEEALEVGRKLREHAKYDGVTPLIVMAEKYGKDLEGTDVNVSGNDWITYPEDADQLHNLIARLVPQAA